jgi:hypothetical protein
VFASTCSECQQSLRGTAFGECFPYPQPSPLFKATIVDQTNVWSNVLQRCDGLIFFSGVAHLLVPLTCDAIHTGRQPRVLRESVAHEATIHVRSPPHVNGGRSHATGIRTGSGALTVRKTKGASADATRATPSSALKRIRSGATGYITSNFTLPATGEVVDIDNVRMVLP